MEVRADRRDLPVNRKILERVTLGDLLERYRDTISNKKRSGNREFFMLNTMLRNPISRRRLSELVAAHFAAYRDDRLMEIKPSSVKRELAPVRHMFEVARHEWGFPIRENPLDKLQLNGRSQNRERRLRPDEFDRLIGACRNHVVEAVIRVAVETGMRRGEILNIRKNHINVTNCTLLIPQTKTDRARIIPLTPRAVAILARRNTDPLFPMTANAFRLAWQRVRARAQITDLRFHDLRHEAISRLFEMGLNAPEVALISGHRDMRMLARYTHPQRQLIQAKLDRGTDKS